METTLVVVRPFGPHKAGDHVIEAADVEATLASEHAHCVVAVRLPAKPVENE